MRYTSFLALACALSVIPAYVQANQSQLDFEAIYDEIGQLHWIEGPAEQDLVSLNAVYRLPSAEMMVKEADAQRYLELTQGRPIGRTSSSSPS